MKKAQSLRDQLNKSVQFVRENPERIHVFIKDGSLVGTLAKSISFEYKYTLNLLITDYTGDADLIMVPVLYWLRENQPDAIMHDKDAFKFEVDILKNDLADIDIQIVLTERVIIKEVDGSMHIEHVPEPSNDNE